MDLKLFFDSLPDHITDFNANVATMTGAISANHTALPSWKKASIALLGVPENRGHFGETSALHPANAVRKHLYSLFHTQKNYNIVDLGNLRLGEDLQQTYLRLSEVCEILLQHQVIPLIIGGSHDLTFAQYKAYEMLDKPIDVVNIDAKCDMEGNSEEAATSHIHSLLMYHPNYLFSFTQMAYQSYLNDHKHIEILKKLGFDALSIGEMRNNFQETEPYIRNATMLSFDLAALKQTHLPLKNGGLPFGLSCEEACQLTWYAGLNEKLSSIGFYGYQPQYDLNEQIAFALATMIWYFIEGFYYRKGENVWSAASHTKYIVPIEKTTESLVFYKGNLSEKWWLEVPLALPNKTESKTKIVPCSYQDYLAALQGEIPDRWIKAMQRGM
jgi:formiminoglutamase